MNTKKKIKLLKRIVIVMFDALALTAIGTFIYSCFTGGSMIKFAIFCSSSTLAYMCYLALEASKKRRAPENSIR